MFRSICPVQPRWPWGLIACLLVGLAQAGPAPWFVWRSKLDGKEVCAQTSPGSAWVQQGGPFLDSDCRKLPPRLLPM
ncbi:MAG: hypothetical protein EKK45_28050 [Curvibacter sp.]|nr:MAG: hypothetical protein EKK45_28050 [Curvibacter sp.]